MRVTRVGLRPSDQDLRRAASRLVSTLLDGELLSGAQPACEEAVRRALAQNFEEESEIEAEARRLLDANRGRTAGMDSQALLAKAMQKLARDRGFVL